MHWIKTKFLLVVFFTYTGCIQTSFPYGKRIYEEKCADCHSAFQQTHDKLYPSLIKPNIKEYSYNIPCIIRYGYNSDVYILEMLGMPELTNVEITNLMNYIENDLNAGDKEWTIKEVSQLLLECQVESKY